MTRAALYARYSSDLQSQASIEDQFRVCRGHAEHEGWTISGCYRDAAISGDSVILRPGVQALLEDARRGKFDVVVAEALDRVSRNQADVAVLFKHLRFAGVPVVTLAEGEITELHVGLKGTMNALFLKDLAAKTRRGLRGRVEKGRSGGGLCYGYDVAKVTDGAGEPVRGERTINDAEAAVVRRVFRDFSAGISPRAIARRLNAEGVPGPSGKLWTDSTIRGHAKRGTGFINNELYIGRLVWNRLRYLKNPDTGKRVSRLNPPEELIVTEVPELRIVDDALWQAVKARQGELTEKYANVIEAVRNANANRLNGVRRPRHLLSGLLECGVCGDPYAMRGQDRYGCSNHVMTGSCANGRGIARAIIEAGGFRDGVQDRRRFPPGPALDGTRRMAHAEQLCRPACVLTEDRLSSGMEPRRTRLNRMLGGRPLAVRPAQSRPEHVGGAGGCGVSGIDHRGRAQRRSLNWRDRRPRHRGLRAAFLMATHAGRIATAVPATRQLRQRARHSPRESSKNACWPGPPGPADGTEEHLAEALSRPEPA